MEGDFMGTKKCSEIVVSVVLIITGVVLLISSFQIEAGTTMGQGGDFMPKLCGVLWLIVSVMLLLSNLRVKDDGIKGITMNLKNWGTTLALLFVYILLLDKIGFTVSSILYMFIQMCLFVPDELRSKQRYVLFAVISVILPIAVNLLFANAFSLILPTGKLF
jgi:putative tricarboxylic transport membrane protein